MKQVLVRVKQNALVADGGGVQLLPRESRMVTFAGINDLLWIEMCKSSRIRNWGTGALRD
jgi:hypothetical protein